MQKQAVKNSASSQNDSPQKTNKGTPDPNSQSPDGIEKSLSKLPYAVLKKTSLLPMIPKLQQKFNSAKEQIGLITRLFQYIKDQKLHMFFAYLALYLTSWAQIKMPHIITFVFNAVIRDNDFAKMQKEILLFLSVAVTYSISEFFWGLLFPLLSQKIRMALRMQVYSSFLTREIEFYDKKHLNDLLHHLDHQIHETQTICTDKFSSIGRNFIQLVYGAWMLAAYSYKLTLVLIAIIPIYLLLSFGHSRLLGKAHQTHELHLGNTSRRVMEVFQNIRIVKALSSERFEAKKYEGLVEQNKIWARNISLVSAINNALSSLLTNLALLGIVSVGMGLIYSGEVAPGDVSGFLLYSLSVPIAFKDLSMNYIRMKECFPSCREVFRLIDEKPKIPYKGGARIENFQGKIEFKNVAFSYPSAPKVPILRDLSVEIKPGDSVAFVGMSGGGKSTIISILLRFYDVYKGEVFFDNRKLSDLDLQWLHEQIGYVSQEPVMFHGTIRDNIVYGLKNYTEEDVKEAVEMANAGFIFNKALVPEGLDTQVGEKGARLSGGQKQRISIARALIRKPKILIFDEATSSLDANSEFDVQKAINDLITNSRITTITIAHRLATIVKCKKIYVIKGGEIVESGSHHDLISGQTEYKNLFERQFSTKH